VDLRQREHVAGDQPVGRSVGIGDRWGAGSVLGARGLLYRGAVVVSLVIEVKTAARIAPAILDGLEE
jgi:hypothetical protein